MKEKLSNINISLLLLIAYTIKIIKFSPNLSDSLALAVLAGTYAFSRYIKIKEPKKSDKVQLELAKVSADVKELKGVLTKVNVSKIADVKKYF